ncbi:MAG TPA: DNA polymerase I, partial [Candidatus Limnocylindrales bacterium]
AVAGADGRVVSADGTFPAAQVSGRPEGWGPGAPVDRTPRQPARPRSLLGEGTGLQLSLDFDSLAATGAQRADGAGGAADGSGERPGRAIRPGDLRSALAAAIADPGHVERLEADGVEGVGPWLAGLSELGVGLVLDDPRPRRGRLLALAVAGADGRVVSADGTDAADALRAVVEAAARPLVGHEVKPLLVERLARAPNEPPLTVAFDTQVAAYLLNASLRSQAIADVVAERLDLVLPPPAAGLPAYARAGLEALGALAVRDSLSAALVEEKLDRLFSDVELPLIPVLARMEAVGVAVDRDALATLDAEFGAEIARLEREIFDAVGHEFTIGSPKQLGDVLFEEIHLPKGKRTKTGYSTDASVLEELRGVHPAIERILDWRVYTKLRSTYVEALPSLIASDGRLHTTFHQAVAATGRLSSSDPNLQNIPIRTPLGRRIRRAFVAGGPDVTLLAADYSQIELRILAHVSGDEHLRDAFAREADIHRETAARVLHKAPEAISHDERSMAKMVNFGIAYGMSDFGLSSRAGIPRAEAQEFINTYFATYSGISYYMLHIKELARTQGWVSTLLGRRRQIPELQARNPSLRGAGERMAINMPIQGTAADIIKIAMIRLAERLRDEGFRARLLLQVHDELLLEVPRDEVVRLAPVVRATMEAALPLDVPLTVDIKVGDDWESMTPLTRVDAIRAEAAELPDEAPAAAAP